MTGLQPHINTRNHFSILSDHENKTSINSNVSKKNSYSDIEKITINNALNSIFDTVYGGQTRAIVTDFLGYKSDNSASTRLLNLIKKCNDLILANNKSKLIDCDAVVFLQTICDPNEAFSSSSLLSQIEQLSKTHYVVLRLVGFPGETLARAINKVANDIGQRSISTLIIRVHGDKSTMYLSNSNTYSIKDVTASDFARLNMKATIIFSSCNTGLSLAKKVALTNFRSVFAYTTSTNDDTITLCCNKHGYCAIAFDNSNNQIVRRFTYQDGYITESQPCCATVEQVQKIKETMLNATILESQSNDVLATYSLGSAYEKGLNITRSRDNAIKLFTQAAEQGYLIAQYKLGNRYYYGENVTQSYEKAAKWYLKAAEQGDADAQLKLGNCYYYGKGVDQSFEKAAKLYEQSANQNNLYAKCALGKCYEKAEGVRKSYEKAVKWYKEAADKDHGEALLKLGDCYYYGRGVDQSYKKAKELYEQSANQENKEAQYTLGYLYEKGVHFPKSNTNAEIWYRKAAEKGHKEAKQRLDGEHSQKVGKKLIVLSTSSLSSFQVKL